MDFNIDPSWKEVLKEEFSKAYFLNLMNYVSEEYTKYECYPPSETVFSAFEYTAFQNVKVIILGQDPYHGPNQAHGLSFSVSGASKIPPSLRNIFKEINEDIGSSILDSGNLTPWATQGVLLLNAILTVRAGEAGSHQRKGWEQFTDAVLEKLSRDREGLVFMLWGGTAQKKEKMIDASKHLILTSGHPSPMSANRGYWFGNKHFSLANEYLKRKGEKPIVW